jgi:hypothetical protein
MAACRSGTGNSGAYNWRITSSASVPCGASPRATASVIVGARDATQLAENLGAVGWALSDQQVARLDAVSYREAPYPYFPYFRQDGFARLNPPVFARP